MEQLVGYDLVSKRRSKLSLLPLAVSIGAANASSSQNCRNLPGGAGWPSSATAWSQLNATVKGQLIATVPQTDVCHTTPFNALNIAACAKLQSSWTQAETYVKKPADRSCQLGNYASYSINMTSAQDVAAVFNFACHKNIRLVVKTAGHDFMGKSTGKGALSLWMFNLKDKSIIHSYSNRNSTYTGPAAKLGAELIAGEADEFVGAAGYRVVSGECPSTGIVGEYTQDGGHSLLGGAYGMAADNVLEWEVVTPAGDHIIATLNSNSDIYWAIGDGGGGGGTFGVHALYVEAFNLTEGLGPLPWGLISTTEAWTSRLVPVSFMQNKTALSSLVSIYCSAVKDNSFNVGCNVLGGGNAPAHPDNAVFPGRRDLAVICNTIHQWDYTAALKDSLAFKHELVSVVQPAIKAVTPGTGVYLNEMDPLYEGDFKTEIYGANYNRLLSIKHTYDPDALLWGLFAVGSTELMLSADRRLCKA
ncbi:hypothetical protein V8C35DRAFT_321201 [Trichoderma chlorosporum]